MTHRFFAGLLRAGGYSDTDIDLFPDVRDATVWGEFRFHAAPHKARELSLRCLSHLVDVVRFSGHVLNGRRNKITPHRGVQHGFSAQPLLIRTDGGVRIMMTGNPGAGRIDLTRNALRLMRTAGVKDLGEIIGKLATQRTDLEEKLLRSLHWFADGLSQAEPENQLMAYVIALEVLFTPGVGEMVATPIGEGVAYLLGNDVDSRLKIRRRVRDWYNSRCSVAHGRGATDIEEELDELASVVGQVISELARRRNEWTSKDKLLGWVERQKFG